MIAMPDPSTFNVLAGAPRTRAWHRMFCDVVNAEPRALRG